MPFFDSPKNRAMWEREMKGLRQEKERRAREGYKPTAGKEQGEKQKDANPFRRPITFQELERQVAERSGHVRREQRPRKEWSVSRKAEKQTTIQADVKKGREL